MSVVFKIVRVNPKNLQLESVNARGKAKVCYVPGKWASAPKWLREKGYHLLAFSSLCLATEEFYFLDESQLWEAEASEIIEGERLPVTFNLEKLKYGQCCRSWLYWPKGTVMSPKIKLIRRLK